MHRYVREREREREREIIMTCTIMSNGWMDKRDREVTNLNIKQLYLKKMFVTLFFF